MKTAAVKDSKIFAVFDYLLQLWYYHKQIACNWELDPIKLQADSRLYQNVCN